MLVNKDQDSDHSVKVAFVGAGQSRHLSGPVDRVVFGPNDYVFHLDPAPPGGPAGGRGGQGGRGTINGHAHPAGPASKSTRNAEGTGPTYRLPKASIIVVRGKVAP